jgi:hypothetical protein
VSDLIDLTTRHLDPKGLERFGGHILDQFIGAHHGNRSILSREMAFSQTSKSRGTQNAGFALPSGLAFSAPVD